MFMPQTRNGHHVMGWKGNEGYGGDHFAIYKCIQSAHWYHMSMISQ